MLYSSLECDPFESLQSICEASGPSFFSFLLTAECLLQARAPSYHLKTRPAGRPYFYASRSLSFLLAPFSTESTKMIVSPQTRLPTDGYSTPIWDILTAPPSTETSSPAQRITQAPPLPQVLMYVADRLRSGSQTHTRRFSFENPAWPDDEDDPLGLPSRHYSIQEDDATIVSCSVRPQSGYSQSTLCGRISMGEDCGSTFPGYSRSPQGYKYKTLQPTPPYGSPKSSPISENFPPRSGKGSVARLSTSGPISERHVSSPLRNDVPPCSFPMTGDRILSWPNFVAQRGAPQPPVVEEKSVWDHDSDSEDEEGASQSSRFKRRFSNPLRAFWCRGKEPRRKSA